MVCSTITLMGTAFLITHATAQQRRAGRAGSAAVNQAGTASGMEIWGSREGYAYVGPTGTGNDVFVGNTYVGSDPDPFIRSQLRRDWYLDGLYAVQRRQ
jgi:hypothetical protein